MGIFNKKITLYVSSDSADNVTKTVADFAGFLEDAGKLDDWMMEHEQGRYERFCNCGAATCADAEVSNA